MRNVRFNKFNFNKMGSSRRLGRILCVKRGALRQRDAEQHIFNERLQMGIQVYFFFRNSLE